MGTWRLILAWLVVADHTNGYGELFNIDIGTVAVATFFFISGFLMPLAYKTSYSKYGVSEGCRRFYINRFLRIYPIYWVSCGLILLGKFFVGYGLLRGHTLNPELVNPLTYVQNFLLLGLNQSIFWGGYLRFNNPAWTLDVELQYYLCVPFIILAASYYRVAVANILIVFSIVSIYLFFYPKGLVDIDRSILAWAIFFVLGFAFEASIVWQRFFSRWIVVIFIVTTLFMASIISMKYINVATMLVTFGFIVVSAYFLIKQKNYRFGALDRLAGDLSYPAYILHFLILGVTANYLRVHLATLGIIPQFFITLFVNILCTTVIAYIALRVIADPIDRIRSRVRGLKERI